MDIKLYGPPPSLLPSPIDIKLYGPVPPTFPSPIDIKLWGPPKVMVAYCSFLIKIHTFNENQIENFLKEKIYSYDVCVSELKDLTDY